MSQNAQTHLKNLLCKSLDWFLYDKDLRHESVKKVTSSEQP